MQAILLRALDKVFATSDWLDFHVFRRLKVVEAAGALSEHLVSFSNRQNTLIVTFLHPDCLQGLQSKVAVAFYACFIA
jgi:hypothetical protein